MSYTNWRQRRTGHYSTRGRAHHTYESQNNQSSSYVQNEHDLYSTSNRGNHRGRSACRGRGINFTQRGTFNYCRGQQRGVNRRRHSTQGTSRDVNSSQTSHGTNTFAKTPRQEKFLDFPFLTQQETVRLLPQFLVMFILRGLPGSGKSTVADTILQHYRDCAVVCSADYYRYNKNGEYVWKEDKLQETHTKCQKRAEKFSALKKPVIIIDNTNVRHCEVEPYIKLAKHYGYVVVLIEPRTPWKFQVRELTQRNTHNVSFAKICKRVEQYDEIVPHYFGWFISQPECARLGTLAKDVLWKCLQIAEFKQCIKLFSDHCYPNFTVHDALSYYSMKHSDSHNLLHVTACFSPSGKYLSGSLYHKSSAVEKALGQISLLTIIGCVVTSETFSARVVLTNKQRELWKNEDLHGQRSKRGHTTRQVQYSVDEMTSSFKSLPLEDGDRASEELQPDYSASASTHVTLGKRQDVRPVQAKYDVETVANYELSSCVFEEYTLPKDTGRIRKYSDTIWAVYFNKAHVIKLPAIFSGYYD